MVSNALVVITVMAALTVSGVHSKTVGNLLKGISDQVELYEKIQFDKGSVSLAGFKSSFSFLQDIQHGNTPVAGELTDFTQKINTLSYVLNADTRNRLNYPKAAEFNKKIKKTLHHVCPRELKCNDLKQPGENYDPETCRTFNGVCNNWQNPLWGAAFTPQERLKNVKGSWERTALQSYTLNREGLQFDTRRIGASPAFKDGPFLIKVKGTKPVIIAGFNQNDKVIKVKKVLRKNEPIVFNGAIISVELKGKDKKRCKLDFQLGSNQVRQAGGKCKEKIVITFFKYQFVFTLQPKGSKRPSIIQAPRTRSASSPSEDHKFATDTFSRYWLNVEKDTVQLTEGTEYVKGTAFLELSAVDVKWNKVQVAIGGEDSTVEFVARDTYKLITDKSETSSTYGVSNSLERISFVHQCLDVKTFFTMRLGVRSKNGPVRILLHGESGGTVTITLKEYQAYVAYTGTTTTATQPEFAKNIKPINFRTASGTVFRGYNSLWVAGTEEGFIMFGAGNQIGKRLITNTALILNENFILNTVSVESDTPANWVWDIEQTNQPRVNSLATGEPLASALDVAIVLHSHREEESTIWSKELTMIAMQWGQFVDHDIAATPLDSIDGHSPICCAGGKVVEGDAFSNVSCFNIRVSNDILTKDELAPNDATTTSCQNFVRSGIILECGVKSNKVDDRERQQMNTLTSFIDASNVYGVSLAEADAVREAKALEEQPVSHNKDIIHADYYGLRHSVSGADLGFLHVDTVGTINGQAELPLATEAGEACAASAIQVQRHQGCRHAGDFRSQENSGLNAMHTLWVREHNRIVKGLLEQEGYEERDVNATFQHARHILAAEMQVINYKEYLPGFLSAETIKKFKLEFDGKCAYNAKVSAALLNLFGILYRYGHTWIADDLAGSSDEESPFEDAITSLPLKENFFNPGPSHTKGSDSVMLNWGKKCPNTDRILENTIQTKLFANLDTDSDVGASLGALNVQRGRDHGVPTYSGLRKVLDLPSVANIDELCKNENFGTELCASIHKVYQSIDDIDTFTAGMIEAGTDSSPIGDIANAALGTMFGNLKIGDRFWYSCYFNEEAVEELKKVRIGNILCDNVEAFSTKPVPEDMFRVSSDTNKKISCIDRPKLDLSKFVTDGGRIEGFNRNGGPKSNTKKKLDFEEEILQLLRELNGTP